jgi:Zn-dependent M28 family amino/carboxypeptidase
MKFKLYGRAILVFCGIHFFSNAGFPEPVTSFSANSYDNSSPVFVELKDNLKKHIKILSSDIGERNFTKYKNLEEAANYIQKEFKNYGYSPEEQVYNLEGRPLRNIMATKKGEVQPDKIIIVCAHYDSVFGSPGADDNASGMAGVLELARIFHKINLNKTVKFIAFTNEEPPFFTTDAMGSLRYAREAKRNGKDIEAVLCLESIGYCQEGKNSQKYPFGLSPFYPDVGNFISLVSNFSSRALLKEIVKEFKDKSNLPLEYLVAPIFFAPAISFSDHWSFWRSGYKAVMITDTALYRNPCYHTQNDTYATLNYEYMSEVIKGMYEVLSELSK